MLNLSILNQMKTQQNTLQNKRNSTNSSYLINQLMKMNNFHIMILKIMIQLLLNQLQEQEKQHLLIHIFKIISKVKNISFHQLQLIKVYPDNIA